MERKKRIKRRTRLEITPAMAIKAIQGSRGIRRKVTDRLDITRAAFSQILKREGEQWDRVRAAFDAEKEYVGDLAEETVQEVMRQRIEMGQALSAAKYHLDRKCRDRGYGEASKLTLEGGENPIDLRMHTILPLDELDLPLKVKKQILTAMEKWEKAPKK